MLNRHQQDAEGVAVVLGLWGGVMHRLGLAEHLVMQPENHVKRAAVIMMQGQLQAGDIRPLAQGAQGGQAVPYPLPL